MLFLHLFTGEYALFYIYLKYRFGWDERQYGLYAAYQNVGMIIGEGNNLDMARFVRGHLR